MNLNADTYYRIPPMLQIDGITHCLPHQMTAAQRDVVIGGAPEVHDRAAEDRPQQQRDFNAEVIRSWFRQHGKFS